MTPKFKGRRRRKPPNHMRVHPSFLALCADYAAQWKEATGFEWSQVKVTGILAEHLINNPPALRVGHLAPLAPNATTENLSP